MIVPFPVFFAAVFFAFKGLVAWPLSLLMAAGSSIGGHGGARFDIKST